jgi:NAD-dependent dihydropyrimidine dehydrogenase PreA subunit
MGCGSCVVTCPGKARTMKLVRTPEHVPVDLGHVFWENTGT